MDNSVRYENTASSQSIITNHKRLIQDIAALMFNLENQRSPEETNPIVNSLLQSLIEQVRLEDEFMRQVAYPDFNQHRREHIVLLRDYNEFKRIFENCGPSTLISLRMQKIFNLFIDHFQRVDRKLGAY
ncbi:MAG: hypothetical protein NTW14_08180 [bacterium]|nr:hypothetical protein [bacterium]